MDRERNGTPRNVGRYTIYDAIATGGMATVHIGRLVGPIGFSRTVAIKRLHPQFARDPEFAEMLLDEAKVASRIRHPNVVPVIDVVADDGELLLVMEYVHGESLSFLLRAPADRTPERTRIVTNIVAGALHGLHAAHETTGDGGKPLGIVHRDVSPQNVLLGLDGIPRVLDFGVAKASGQVHCTGAGRVKGKLRYVAPELIRRQGLDRRADLWSASVMLWESLTGRRLFSGDNEMAIMTEVLEKPIPSPRTFAPELPEPLVRAIMRGLSRDPAQRFATAIEMASALEDAVGLLGPREIGAWVGHVARAHLEARRRVLTEIEERAVTPEPSPPSATALTMTAGMVPSSHEPTAVHRAVQRPRAWLVPWTAGAAVAMVAMVTVAFTIHRADGPVAAGASMPVASAPGTSMPVASALGTSAPVASALGTSMPVASAPVASATATAAASARPLPASRGAKRSAGRAASTAGPSADFRAPLYGRD